VIFVWTFIRAAIPSSGAYAVTHPNPELAAKFRSIYLFVQALLFNRHDSKIFAPNDAPKIPGFPANDVF